MVRKGAVLLGAAVWLGACTTPMFTMPPGPQDYRLGFSEGCDAGYAVAGSPFYATLDKAEPPRTDQPYLTGWQAGYNRCKRNYQRIQSVVSSVLSPR